MAVKFAIGDVVKLRSDGPWMTVVKDRPEAGSKFVVAAWFNGSALSTETFPKDALEHDPARKVAEEKKADKPATE
jgi:uncharacterized protein YodC (DUF2158 family)